MRLLEELKILVMNEPLKHQIDRLTINLVLVLYSLPNECVVRMDELDDILILLFVDHHDLT